MVVDSVFHAMGDVNWDGVIDQADLDRLSAAFGSVPGSPNWDADCDLNGDGRVDGLDLTIAAFHYGAKAPEYTTPYTVQVAAGKVILNGVQNSLQLSYTFTRIADGSKTRVIFEFNPTGGRVLVPPTLGLMALRTTSMPTARTTIATRAPTKIRTY